MFRISIAALICFALCGSLCGQTPAIRVIQDLSFGELVADERGGGIVLTPEGVLVPFNQAVQATGRSLVQEARFVLTGPPKAQFRFDLNPPTPFLTESRGARIRIQAFQLPAAGNVGSFDAQGQATLRLGARLDIPAGAPPGVYQMQQAYLQVSVLDLDSARPVSQEFTITAKLRPTLQLVNLAPLDFGCLIPGSTVGRYVVTAGGGARTEGAGGPRQFRGTPRAAEFFISGTVGACYSIELPRKVLLNGPGASLEIQDFHSNVPLQAMLPPGGQRFQVGASLVVPSQQEPGLYRGLFTVSVDYQ
jgi:hypothetical protein